jgi:hypothetical protein
MRELGLLGQHLEFAEFAREVATPSPLKTLRRPGPRRRPTHSRSHAILPSHTGIRARARAVRPCTRRSTRAVAGMQSSEAVAGFGAVSRPDARSASRDALPVSSSHLEPGHPARAAPPSPRSARTSAGPSSQEVGELFRSGADIQLTQMGPSHGRTTGLRWIEEPRAALPVARRKCKHDSRGRHVASALILVAAVTDQPKGVLRP